MPMDRFRFGLAGLTGPLTERRLYGDAGPSLEAYGRMFGAYEVGASRYEHWTADLSQDLVDRMPAHVHLIPRMSRAIVHQAGLDGLETELDRWIDAVAPLLRATNKGPLLLPWQESWTPDGQDRLQQLLDELWPRLPASQRIAVEFQHGTWFRPEPVHLLEEYGASLVWSTAAGRVPYRATADAIYVRLTGTQTRRIPDEVAALASRIDQRPEDRRPVYVISSRSHDPYGLRALQRFAESVGRTVRYGADAAMPSDVPSQPSLLAYA